MDRQEIVEELRRLVQSRNNDGVKLAFLSQEDLKQIGRLDLRGVAEFKRSEKGCFEIRFIDKVKALELLERLCREESEGALDAFLEGLREGEAQ